ncbi:SDR family NAD(P)-dependent oxidoreductase [Pedomonas sp. V897]|uniref:SDR family NAD(P)-dependent oxidoreductase n=1 Tax=Pedomonas sp. V897 TaxID=3446482 RepID=UPI003EE0A628
MGRVSGKVAIVTGAASDGGLGFATARALAREGAKVVLTDLNEAEVLKRGEELRAAGGDVLALAQDVTDEAQWDQVIARTREAYGQLDILVNNAGVAILKWMDAMTLADFERQIRINLTSVYLGSAAALKVMRAQGKGGVITNLSSIAGLVGVPGASAYAASKAGVRAFTKSIALEAARDNIRCNSVHPGVIWTDMQKVAIRDNPEQYDILNASIPMGRMGEPDDIANMILFLSSDEAKYITGAEFTVDGGLTAQ